MPKRKHSDDNQDYYDREIKKLERKLKHARKRKRRVSSSTSSSPERISLPDLDPTVAEPVREPSADLYTEELVDAAIDNTESECLPETLKLPTHTNEELSNAMSTTQPEPESEMSNDLLEILGKDLSSVTEFGPDIRNELSIRLQHIATAGLDKDTRKELSTKYLIPSNCTKIAAPLINDEIKAALPETIIKRDKGLESRQKRIASVISCLSYIISSQIQSNNKDTDTLKKLMDAIRILCDVQFCDSMKRRFFASTTLKKEINDHISKTKVDAYLFGENLADTLKSAKAVSKSGFEIKIVANNNKFHRKPLNLQPQPSTSKNWKPPSTSCRPQSGPPRGYQPARPPLPPPVQPGRGPPPSASSKPSRYPPRQNYRH